MIHLLVKIINIDEYIVLGSNVYSGAKPNEPSFASETKKD